VSATPETAQWQEAREGGGRWRVRRGRRTEPSASEHLPGRCAKATQPRNRPSRDPHGPPGPWCAARSSAMRRRLLGRCRSQLSAARGLCGRGAESAPEDSGGEGQRPREQRRRVVRGAQAHTRHRHRTHTVNTPPLCVRGGLRGRNASMHRREGPGGSWGSQGGGSAGYRSMRLCSGHCVVPRGGMENKCLKGVPAQMCTFTKSIF
jgi:hypothetical protein